MLFSSFASVVPDLNRLTTKTTREEGTVWYNYDEGGHGWGKGRLTSIAWGSNVEGYQYDERGRLTLHLKMIDGIVKAMGWTYDSMDRIVTETYPDGEVVTYTYGADGNLVSVTSPVAQYATNLQYTAQSKLKQILYGNGITTTYSYYDNNTDTDASNGGRKNSYRLKGFAAVKGGTTIAQTGYEYDAVDNMKKKTFSDSFGAAYSETFAYDELDRLTNATGSGLYGYKIYAYDIANNITQKDEKFYEYSATTGPGGRTLPHAVSRLKRYDNTTVSTYEYDSNGNMTKAEGHTRIVIKAKSAAGAPPAKMELFVNGNQAMIWDVTNSEDWSDYIWHGFWYEGDRIDVVFSDNRNNTAVKLYVEKITVNGIAFAAETAQYDRGEYLSGCFDLVNKGIGQQMMNEEGSLQFIVTGIPKLSRILTYDRQNRVVSINEGGMVSNYQYDPSGQRIIKTTNGTTTRYFFPNYEVETKSGTPERATKYYYANGMRIAQRSVTDTTDELLYITSDHLGSAVRLTDTAGNPVQSYVYGPFGEMIYSSGTRNMKYQYTGQEYDVETALSYYKARYYDPMLGRFTQPDTVLDGLNRYAYCGNNPINYTDPTGHEAQNNPPAVTQGPNGNWSLDPNGSIHTSGENGGTQNPSTPSINGTPDTNKGWREVDLYDQSGVYVGRGLRWGSIEGKKGPGYNPTESPSAHCTDNNPVSPSLENIAENNPAPGPHGGSGGGSASVPLPGNVPYTPPAGPNGGSNGGKSKKSKIVFAPEGDNPKKKIFTPDPKLSYCNWYTYNTGIAQGYKPDPLLCTNFDSYIKYGNDGVTMTPNPYPGTVGYAYMWMVDANRALPGHVCWYEYDNGNLYSLFYTRGKADPKAYDVSAANPDYDGSKKMIFVPLNWKKK